MTQQPQMRRPCTARAAAAAAVAAAAVGVMVAGEGGGGEGSGGGGGDGGDGGGDEGKLIARQLVLADKTVVPAMHTSSAPNASAASSCRRSSEGERSASDAWASPRTRRSDKVPSPSAATRCRVAARGGAKTRALL